MIVGVIVIVGSVAGGLALASSSARTEPVLAVTHDVASGMVLTPGDVRVVSVRLSGLAGRYVSARSSVAGQTTNREVRAGELLPASALGRTEAATTVSIPLGADEAPKIRPGERITVWVSTKACPSATVLSAVTVQDVEASHGTSFGSSGGESVVVRVSSVDAERVIEALALAGATIRAGVLSGQGPGSAAATQLSACADGGS